MRFFWIRHGNLLKDKGLGIPWKWKICLIPKNVCWIIFSFSIHFCSVQQKNESMQLPQKISMPASTTGMGSSTNTL